jgi:hypothetical protein
MPTCSSRRRRTGTPRTTRTHGSRRCGPSRTAPYPVAPIGPRRLTLRGVRRCESVRSSHTCQGSCWQEAHRPATPRLASRGERHPAGVPSNGPGRGATCHRDPGAAVTCVCVYESSNGTLPCRAAGERFVELPSSTGKCPNRPPQQMRGRGERLPRLLGRVRACPSKCWLSTRGWRPRRREFLPWLRCAFAGAAACCAHGYQPCRRLFWP